MANVRVVATAGAGGDLQPLIAAALALQARGHTVEFTGDASVQRALAGTGAEVLILPAQLDLGPRLMKAVRDAMSAAGGEEAAAGPLVVAELSRWAAETAAFLGDLPMTDAGLLITSLFGAEVLARLAPPVPWAVINSTFYVGPSPPRAVTADFSPRAAALIEHYASLLDSAGLVLHATDQVFDLSFDMLPETHRYAGPLGIWEPPPGPMPWLEEPGDPWVLVSISSQAQDDLAIARAAVDALGRLPFRGVVTLGPGHEPGEIASVPTSVRVEQTVSHSRVLEVASVLVSHAGHGSVMKALWHGCPMVLVPWGRDQPGVAARAGSLGVAKVIPREEATAGTLEEAIVLAAASEPMRSAAEMHSARLQATDWAGSAAQMLEALL